MLARSTERVFALLLAAALAGCADLTSGGARGNAQAYLNGDDPSHVESPPAAARPTSGGAALREADASVAIDATVTVGAQVFLDGGPEGRVELTSGVQTVSTPAQGAADVKIADASVAAGLYTTVRVVFTRVEADVRSGLTVGGVPITGVVRVSASAQDPIAIERSLRVEVAENGSAAVLVDLNTPVWLATTTPGTNVVARGAFTSAVAVARR